MFLGHYGVALGAKRAAPKTSLGTLVFAAQFVDELWPILLIAGVEQVRIVPGLMAANSLDFVHYPFTHSLLMGAVWAVLIGAVYFAVRRYRTGGWVVGAAVLSHWVLDLFVHGPDLPLWPGSSIMAGMGAWNSVPLTILLELAFFGGGLFLYLRTTRARDGIGSWGLWAMVAVLVLFYFTSTFGAPPSNVRVVAFGSLILWLFVPWGWWVDRHRELRGVVAGGGGDAPINPRPSARASASHGPELP
jgi:membrane-bound metal-dependent hydrolase YbcI (DUF457 family)